MVMPTVSLLDQLREALASDSTAMVFIEAFLGLITNERKMFLEHLVMKLQFEDLYLVLQKASQRIHGQKLVVQDSDSDIVKNVKIEVTTAFVTAKENAKCQNVTLTKRNNDLEKTEAIKEECEESGGHENTININSPAVDDHMFNEEKGDHFLVFTDERTDPLHASDEDGDEMLQLNTQNTDNDNIGLYENELKCNICLKPHPTKRALQQHLYSHQEPKHKCEFCDQKFNRPAKLKAHTRIHTGEKPYQCDQCDYAFRDKNLLRMHHNREHVDKAGGPYFCPFCPLKIFSTTGTLSEHNQQMHKVAKFKCEYCDLKFNKTFLLKIHRRLHTGETPFKCDHCDKSFRGKDLRRMHVARVHMNKVSGPYYCDLCPQKVFSTTETLKKHKQHLHINKVTKLEKVRPSCEECSKTFLNNSELEEHMGKHTGVTPYICSLCPKTFISQKAVKVHEIWHEKNTSPINLMCEHCSKICTTRDQWNYHLKTHQDKTHQFKCDLCPDRTFSTSVNLNTHKRTHTKEKPYKCDECSKSFAHNNSLQIHIRIHKGIRPFPCDFCEKKFTDQTGLRKHRRKHTGEKPYHCDKCDRSFTQCTQLKTHKCHGRPTVNNPEPN